MSYILDAIKKADQKRDLGSVPDVNTVHETPPIAEPRRSAWLYGLAAILIVNAVGIGWWLRPESGDKAPVGQVPEKAAVAEGAAKMADSKPPSAVPAKSPLPTPVASAPSLSPTQPVQTQAASKPVINPAAVQAEATKPPVPSPPAAAPVDKVVAVAENETAPPATLASVEPPQPVKVESPPVPVSSPPPPPTSVQTETLPKDKPVNPFAAQAVAVQAGTAKATSAPVPPAVVAKAPATARAEKGNIDVAPPKVENPAPGAVAAGAGVVPVLKPDTSAANPSPEEEPLVGAEEKEILETSEAADGEAPAAEAEERQAMVPIAASPAPKSKAKPNRGSDKEEEDPELAKIPFFKQLPPDVQQTIPELHISFHSYSIKPAARLVSISGKILREGESYDENVKLETITVKGVVLVYKGRRFRLEV